VCVLVVGWDEQVVDPGILGDPDEMRHETSADASPLMIHAHRDVVDEDLARLRPRHRQSVRGESTHDLFTPCRREGPELVAREELGEILVAQALVFLFKHFGHRGK
jgi:hypothetical protein